MSLFKSKGLQCEASIALSLRILANVLEQVEKFWRLSYTVLWPGTLHTLIAKAFSNVGFDLCKRHIT